MVTCKKPAWRTRHTNKKRVEANPKLYKRRQAIVEHPYGTIKRQWGFNYITTKQTIKRPVPILA